jgi:hypothetical protein
MSGGRRDSSPRPCSTSPSPTRPLQRSRHDTPPTTRHRHRSRSRPRSLSRSRSRSRSHKGSRRIEEEDILRFMEMMRVFQGKDRRKSSRRRYRDDDKDDEEHDDKEINQVSYLPRRGKFEADKIVRLKHNGSNRQTWIDKVQSALTIMSLTDIIDPNLPHPEKTDRRYERWSYWTGSIRRWLLSNVEECIKSLVVTVEKP